MTRRVKEPDIIKKQMKGMQTRIDKIDKRWQRMEENLKESITKKLIEILNEREDRKKE